MNPSTQTSISVLTALLRGGATDVVLAPGSRSSALAVVLQQAEAQGLIKLHVRIDERTAGFLALGLAKGSHRPVAVVTTSGTAVVNLHPAILEALHVGETLLALTADRPAHLRGTGANQTTDQKVIFGPHVRCIDVPVDDPGGAARAVDEAVERRGPTHINLQFSEPLLPSSLPLDLSEPAAVVGPARALRPQLTGRGGSVRLSVGPRTVVVAGDDAGPQARLLAEGANWPLLAEPTSGARTGGHAIRCYRLLLDTRLVEQIERVIVVGHPTLSRPVTKLISRSDIEVVAVVGPTGVATDPGRVARHVAEVPVVEGAADTRWVDVWRAADALVSGRLDSLVASDPDALPLRIAAEVAAAVTPEALLVVGSSQPIRDLDLMALPYPTGERRLVIANRGLAGIDGTISTAVGAALGRQSSRALAYMGDLTFLHDLTGLVIGPHEQIPDLTIVVANDEGGAIFSTLEPGGETFATGFERIFGTPHSVDLEGLCAATGVPFTRVLDATALRSALAEQNAGLRVLEVPLSRSHRRRLAERIDSLASLL